MGIKVLGRSEYDRDLVMGGGSTACCPKTCRTARGKAARD